MDYRRLGRTDLRVSALGLGTMTFGEQNTEAEGHAQMDLAVDRGINLFDTAELYPIPPKAETQGRADRIIGSWLKSRRCRDRIVLASKVVGYSENGWFRDAGAPTRLTRAQVHEAIDKGLKRLGTDYIDLFQMHWPDRPVTGFGSVPTVYRLPEAREEVAIEETLAALGDAVTAGKIRHVGVSNESPWGAMRCLQLAETQGLPRIQSIQNAYSLVNRTFETGLAEIAVREDVGLIAYSTLAQGFLTGKYLGGALPVGARKTLFNRSQRYETPGADAAIAAYVALAAELGVDPARLAIRFAATRPFTTSVLLGATSMGQLETDISGFELAWTPEIEARIDAIHLIHQNPCP